MAALFALHPLHVESVAWVAERKDLLSTFFFLLTLWAYARYAEGGMQSAECRMQKPEGPGPWSVGRGRWSFSHLPPSIFYSLSLAFFALGLMSKPMLVTLPFVLLLLDYWPLQRFEPAAPNSNRKTLRSLLLEKVPFFALSAPFLRRHAPRPEAGRSGGAAPGNLFRPALLERPGFLPALRCANSFGRSDLAVIYPYVFQWPLWLIALAIAFLLGMTFLALKWRRSAPYFPVGWLWFLGTLVPVVGLIQVGEQAMADRYTYIPSIGFFIVISWAMPQLAARWPRRRPAWALGAAFALAALRMGDSPPTAATGGMASPYLNMRLPSRKEMPWPTPPSDLP